MVKSPYPPLSPRSSSLREAVRNGKYIEGQFPLRRTLAIVAIDILTLLATPPAGLPLLVAQRVLEPGPPRRQVWWITPDASSPVTST